MGKLEGEDSHGVSNFEGMDISENSHAIVFCVSEVEGKVCGGWCKQLHTNASHVSTWEVDGMFFSSMSRDEMAQLEWDFFWKTDCCCLCTDW